MKTGMGPEEVRAVKSCVCITTDGFVGASATGIDPMGFARITWNWHWSFEGVDDLAQAARAHAMEIGAAAIESSGRRARPGEPAGRVPSTRLATDLADGVAATACKPGGARFGRQSGRRDCAGMRRRKHSAARHEERDHLENDFAASMTGSTGGDR